jgi:hypothetical protein
MTKCNSSEDNVTFEETVKAPELFRKQFINNPKSLFLLLSVSKGRQNKLIDKLKCLKVN